MEALNRRDVLAASTAPRPVPGLESQMDITSGLAERAGMLVSRLQALEDRVHGSGPVSDSARTNDQPARMGHVGRLQDLNDRLDRAFGYAEDTITRIEQTL